MSTETRPDTPPIADPGGAAAALGASPLVHRLRALLRWVGDGRDVPGRGPGGAQGITEAAPLVGGAGVTPLGTVLTSTAWVPELHRAWGALLAARLLSQRRHRARVTAAGRRWLESVAAPQGQTSRRLLKAYVDVVLEDRSQWDDPFQATLSAAVSPLRPLPAHGWWRDPALDERRGWLDEGGWLDDGGWRDDEADEDDAAQTWEGDQSGSWRAGQPLWLQREELVIALLGRLATVGRIDLRQLANERGAVDALREILLLQRSGLVETNADAVHLATGLRPIVRSALVRWAGTSRSGWWA